MIPKKYVKVIGDTVIFNKAIFVDRHNQNITALERTEKGKWVVRSMNPSTTGLHRPPYAQETPLGMFVLQEKKVKMIFLKDGSKETGGYAPYASRFTDGAYIHGVPVNEPRKTQIEYSWSLGTTPRSHMCVRNATSHAKFIFDWAPVNETIILFWNKNPYLYRDFISSLNPMLQKVILFLSFLFIPFSHVSVDTMAVPASDFPTPVSELAAGEQLFEEMELGGIVNFIAFRQAVAGYNRIKEKSKPILTLIDFSKPSTEKRFFVFDMEKKQLLYSSVVSHGRNSGENYATSFSNQNGSYKSSLGFYLTENTYQGGNGYSLILNGLEKGINDKAKERSIVVHGASYANPTVAASGRLGRSLGCPALPTKLAKPIINTIKDGSVMFIYANNSSYLAQSDILKNVSAPMPAL